MADEYQVKSRAFCNWFQTRRTTISSKIQLADLRHRNAGRGVVATQNIFPDEELFSVSRADILSVENSDFVTTHGGRNVLEGEEDQWISLIIVMIYEFLRGHQSPWKPYFDVLPTEFNTLMFWSDAELDQLQASAVSQKIGKQQANTTLVNKVVVPVRQNQSLFPAASSFSDEDLLYLAHRMGSTIMAYAFDIEKEPSQQEVDEDGYASDEEEEFLPKGMVPMADMLNADADLNNARLFYGESVVTMKALKPIAAGEEIFNDYGPLPSADLLRRYGYITQNYSQYDVVEIPQRLVVDVFRVRSKQNSVSEFSVEGGRSVHCSEADMRQELVQEKLHYLDQYDALEDGYDIYRNPEESLFPSTLRSLIWTLDLTEASFKDKKQSKPRRAVLDVSDPDSVRFLAILQDILQERLLQYPTSLADDDQLAERVAHSPPQNVFDYRMSMALHTRIGEKQILENAITQVHSAYVEASNRHLS